MKTANTQKSPSLRYDLVLISALLLVSLLFLAINLFTRVEGNYVEVTDTEKGIVVATYSLAKDGIYELGGGSNILVIENGRAYVKYANCPGQQCVKKGRIHYVGESIVCAHNRIVIAVKGKTPDVDVVS